jgi:hypothetical protein
MYTEPYSVWRGCPHAALIRIAVTVCSILAVPEFLLNIIDPDLAALSQAAVRLLDAAQEARIVFELMIKPVILGRETDQQSGCFSVTGLR